MHPKRGAQALLTRWSIVASHLIFASYVTLISLSVVVLCRIYAATRAADPVSLSSQYLSLFTYSQVRRYIYISIHR